MTETAELAVRNTMRTIAKGTDVPTTLTEMKTLTHLLHTSKMLPKHLLNDEASIMLVMFACNSLDVPLWAGIQGIDLIEGKTALAAQMIQSLVLRAGYVMFPVMEDCNLEQGVVRCVRPGIGKDGSGETLVKFTLEDAIQAKLVDQRPDGTLYARSKNGQALPWEKYGNQMLVWRAISKAGRNFFPDLLYGMSYTADELEGELVEREPTQLKVAPEVSAAALRILNAQTNADLREVWQEVRAADLLDASNMRGETLDQLLRQRAETIRIRTGETAPKVPETAADDDEAPPVEEGTPEPGAAESTEQPTGDDVKVEPDPEDTRINDDEREALCDLLGGIHPDGWPGVEADVLEERGLHPDQVATEWLQDYAQRLVDTQKGQQK